MIIYDLENSERNKNVVIKLSYLLANYDIIYQCLQKNTFLSLIFNRKRILNLSFILDIIAKIAKY